MCLKGFDSAYEAAKSLIDIIIEEGVTSLSITNIGDGIVISMSIHDGNHIKCISHNHMPHETANVAEYLKKENGTLETISYDTMTKEQYEGAFENE